MLGGVSLSWRVVRMCLHKRYYASVSSGHFCEFLMLSLWKSRWYTNSVACHSEQVTCLCLRDSAVRNGGSLNVLGV